MAICEHTQVGRWTPRRINAALRCPKPTGEIARFYRAQSGTAPGSTRQPPITAMIAAFIARHADILSVPSAAAFEDPWRTPGKPSGWLLVPATVEAILDGRADAGPTLAEAMGGCFRWSGRSKRAAGAAEHDGLNNLPSLVQPGTKAKVKISTK